MIKRRASRGERERERAHENLVDANKLKFRRVKFNGDCADRPWIGQQFTGI